MAATLTNQTALNVIAQDELGNALIVFGTTQPTDGTSGYAPSCLFLKSNGTIFWNNASNATSCNFDQITLP